MKDYILLVPFSLMFGLKSNSIGVNRNLCHTRNLSSHLLFNAIMALLELIEGLKYVIMSSIMNFITFSSHQKLFPGEVLGIVHGPNKFAFLFEGFY